jgi:hypothetical protein
MSLPGGFRPNPNLSEFIVCAILDLIYIWNNISNAIMQIQPFLIKALAVSGMLGSTI